LSELGFEPKALFTGGCGIRALRPRPARRRSARSARSAARHTPEEFMEVETLVPRAQALAMAILRLAPHA